MKSLVLAPFSEKGLARIGALGSVTHEPWTATQTLWDPEELGTRLTNEGFDALAVEADFLFEELFDAAPGLRIAAVCRAALNHVDLDAATDRGVVIIHTPGRNAQAVAELVVWQMLTLARHTHTAERYVRNSDWNDPTEPYTRFRGRELAGATLGIIGLGAIGLAVVRPARGLGMHVLSYDPYVPKATGVPMASLKHLMSESDFVTIHAPDTPETNGMLDEALIGRMKPSAYLLNDSSPGIVNRDALADALANGRLAGAALDVHDAHPIPPDSPFLRLPNVLLTPHIGGATQETIERHSAMVAADFELFARGKAPKNLANPLVWKGPRAL